MPLDGFLKIDGIDGECKDADHPAWLNVFGVRWGMSQEVVPAPDGSFAAGTPTVQSFEFTQPFGRASVPLFQACCTGRQLPSMVFEGCVADGDSRFVYMHVEFKDCLVTSVQTGSTGAEVTEQVEVVFRSVNVLTKERPH